MAAPQRRLIAGNWKMNGLWADGFQRARALAAAIAAAPPACDVLVCPPATLIAATAKALAATPVLLGGQDCHGEDKGAFTGDIAAPMLADLGCAAVIVGHSERRRDHGETDARVRAKAQAAHRAGLIAVVCVGETESERDSGRTDAVIEAQIAGSVPGGATAANTVVAYEPVWAIGTGRTPMHNQIVHVHNRLRELLVERLGVEGGHIRLLYGGSVTARNAAEILAIPNVDGALVGGASLKVDDFVAICRSCAAD
ncbi:MAG: triose-phosphate isomerase [Alphaproteobacteria bacterium]